MIAPAMDGRSLPQQRPDHVAGLADDLVVVRRLLESGGVADLAAAVVRVGRVEQAIRIHVAATGAGW